MSRHSPVPLTLIIFALIFPAAAGAAADAGGRAALAVAPETTAAARAAAVTFLGALVEGDAGLALQSACVGDPAASSGGTLVRAMALNLAGESRLAEALVARFGESACAVTPRAAVERLRSVAVEISVDGERAGLSCRAGGGVLPLKNVAGAWKVDVAELAERLGATDEAEALDAALARANASAEVVADLASGKYESAEEARVACREKVTLARREEAASRQASTDEPADD